MDNNNLKQQILDAFYFRHSTKQFDPTKKIPEDDFQFILETARLSPSSFGFEPWRFVVVQNDTLRQKIKDISWGAYGKLPDASHFVIILARTKVDMKYDSEYLKDHLTNVMELPEDVIRKYLGRVQEFQEKDFKLVDDDRYMFDWASKQSYIPLANMMTVAAQIGVDSCPIEGFDIEKMNSMLDDEGLLEDGRFGISAMIAFGYRAENTQKPKKRRPFEDIVKWVE